MEWRGIPAFLQAFLAFSIEEEMFTDRPRSSSLMRLTKASALARLSNTAAMVPALLMPSSTFLKFGLLRLPQWPKMLLLLVGRREPPCSASPRLQGRYSAAICMKRFCAASASPLWPAALLLAGREKTM